MKRFLKNLFFTVIFLNFFASCNVLFWKDTKNWDGGFWLDSEIFYEVQHNYEKKAEWFPLNQNVLARNYETTILKCKVSAPDQCEEVASYEGWTLSRSLQGNGSQLFAIRGTSDRFGTGPRQFIRIGSAEEPVVLFDATQEGSPELLGSTMSTDGSKVVLIASDSAGLKFFIYKLPVSDAEPATVVVPGQSGMPSYRWGLRPGDSDVLYFSHNSGNIYKIQNNRASAASEFPQCFNAIETQVSDSGKMFYRTREGQREFRDVEGWLSPDRIPYISNPARLGANCP